MAAQQGAPSRPWFRLATMVRPPPAPTPQPEQAPPPPRPAFIRPAFSQTFRAPPTVPPPQTTVTPPAVSPPRPTATLPAANGVAPTSPPQPPAARPSPPRKEPSSSTPRTSPLQQSRPPSPAPTPPPPPQPSYSPPTITRSHTPTYSPPTSVRPLEKNSPPSPPIKPVSHPPSPLALPSPQIKPEYEQKTMVVQETKEIPKNLDNGINGDIRRHSGNWGTRNPKKPETSKKQSDSEDFGMRIITIAGENKGAIMELSPKFGKKTRSFGDNPHRLQMTKDNPSVPSDGEKSGSNSDGKSKATNKNHKSKSPLMSAVMNSNVQGVNNSILYNCSTTHHDPGVHLSLSRKPGGAHGFYRKDHIN
ncbi:hypothetical protein L1887_41768 [Cichorium endivia]|nr:hypothetical protein L1887_41768 [Cichorium endivia]